MARYTQAGRGETDAGGDARARGGKKINLYGSGTGSVGHRESPKRKSWGWDEPKTEKVQNGVDGDRRVVTQDRVLIKSEHISPQPA